jgi:hypothetical protein
MQVERFGCIINHAWYSFPDSQTTELLFAEPACLLVLLCRDRDVASFLLPTCQIANQSGYYGRDSSSLSTRTLGKRQRIACGPCGCWGYVDLSGYTRRVEEEREDECGELSYASHFYSRCYSLASAARREARRGGGYGVGAHPDQQPHSRQDRRIEATYRLGYLNAVEGHGFVEQDQVVDGVEWQRYWYRYCKLVC